MKRRTKSYEESLDRWQRRAAGVYYTPTSIVEQMVQVVVGEGVDVDLSDKLLLDPCCGSGNFLVEALRVGFRAENIYGFDIDPKGVKIARQRVAELSGYDVSKNIKVADFFDRAQTIKRRFDYVITNPPWGSSLDVKRRNILGQIYGAGHSVDSSSLMMLASLMVLREGGVLSFLLPEAFFNIGNFEDVRRVILGLRVTCLCDYAKPFRGLMTRAQAIVLRKESSTDEDVVRCRYDGHYHTRTIGSFKRNPKSIMNLWLTQAEADVVEAIYKKPHVTLQGGALWGMGIVTGNNKKYCSDHPHQGYIGVLRGYDLTEEGINAPTTFIPSDLSQYNQVAPKEFYLAPEKIIYRFITSRAIFRYDTERRYILNSVNGFIPNRDFPIPTKLVAELLNSKVLNWLFRAIFHTHKVLRHDIETLPLHYELTEFNESNYLDYLGVEATELGSYKIVNVEQAGC
ncbi:MAG: TaqI-like C-terminal specificity domain-containing protein [Rikenellaceae bacterium]